MKFQHVDVNGGACSALCEVGVWLIHSQHCKVVEFAVCIECACLFVVACVVQLNREQL